MIPGFQERAKDRIALGSLLEAYVLEMPVKNLLRLADHLPGKVGLIINTFLEHGRESEYHSGILKMKFIFS
jgi:hypothetical protein